MVITVIFITVNANQSTASSSGVAAAETSNKDGDCLKDLRCAGDKFTAYAEKGCLTMLEDQAKIIAKWDYKIGDGGTFDFIFTKLNWVNDSKKQIVFFGDKAKFQNGFGAWKRVSYSCIIDIASGKPVSAAFDELDNNSADENATTE